MAVAAGTTEYSTKKTRQLPKTWAPETLYAYLEERARRRGQPMTELIRTILTEEMERHPLPGEGVSHD